MAEPVLLDITTLGGGGGGVGKKSSKVLRFSPTLANIWFPYTLEVNGPDYVMEKLIGFNAAAPSTGIQYGVARTVPAAVTGFSFDDTGFVIFGGWIHLDNVNWTFSKGSTLYAMISATSAFLYIFLRPT